MALPPPSPPENGMHCQYHVGCCDEEYIYEGLASGDSMIRVLEILPGDEISLLSLYLHQVHLQADDDSAYSYHGFAENINQSEGGGTRDPLSMHVFAAQTLKFTALSYTWGSPKAKKLPICIDGKRFMVGPNLEAALRVLRATLYGNTAQVVAKSLFWIDAICINQDDVDEKNRQVGQMGRIFRFAHDVIIWLGVFDDNEQQILRSWQVQRQQGSANLDTASLDVLKALLYRDYWHRTWIVQEVILASSIRLLCGMVVLEWEDLLFLGSMVQSASLLAKGSAMDLMSQRLAIGIGENTLLEQNLENLITRYHGTKCQDPRDRVFAFLSLAADCTFDQGVVPDYSIQRLPLLVMILRYCRPEKPVQFISILFQALTADSDADDDEWGRASSAWVTACNASQKSSSTVSVEPSASDKQQLAYITHFITAASTSQSWARCYTFEAVFDKTSVSRSAKQDEAKVGISLNKDVNSGDSVGYSRHVFVHDESHVSVLIQDNHYAVFSTSTLTLVANPCAVIRAHDSTERCTARSCGIRRVLP